MTILADYATALVFDDELRLLVVGELAPSAQRIGLPVMQRIRTLRAVGLNCPAAI